VKERRPRRDDDFRIAGEYRCAQWRALSRRLADDGAIPDGALESDWQEAIDIIRVRLTTRFADPLDALRSFEYAGFLMTAIDCLLAEAIQRLRLGRRKQRGESSFLLATFLRESSSLDGCFVSAAHREPLRDCPCIACDFYRNVRSAIVHDAETQNGWRIRYGEPLLVQEEGPVRVLDRNRFHDAIVAELTAYLADLARPERDALRANLKKTLDALCEPDADANSRRLSPV